MTLQTIAGMPSYIMNISATFHWNPSIKYSDIASHEIGANRLTTDGWP